MRDVTLVLKLTAAAGGAITWTFPATYVLNGGGTTITGADLHTTITTWLWDADTSKWREAVTRSDGLT